MNESKNKKINFNLLLAYNNIVHNNRRVNFALAAYRNITANHGLLNSIFM